MLVFLPGLTSRLHHYPVTLHCCLTSYSLRGYPSVPAGTLDVCSCCSLTVWRGFMGERSALLDQSFPHFFRPTVSRFTLSVRSAPTRVRLAWHPSAREWETSSTWR